MKIPIDEVSAGPAMDAAVAEALGNCPHVLEKTIHWSLDGCGEVCYECERCHKKFWGLAYKEGYCILPYSTDIVTAWPLFEKLKHRDATLGWSKDWLVPCVNLPVPGGLIAEKNLGCFGIVYGETHAEAICRAFLKVNEVAEIERGIR